MGCRRGKRRTYPCSVRREDYRVSRPLGELGANMQNEQAIADHWAKGDVYALILLALSPAVAESIRAHAGPSVDPQPARCGRDHHGR